MDQYKRVEIILLVALGWVFQVTPALTEPVNCEMLVEEAVDAFREGDIEEARLYTQDVIRSCQVKASAQQRDLRKQFPHELQLWFSSTETGLYDKKVLPQGVLDERLVSIGWEELNAVGKALFIEAEIYKQEGRDKEARQQYQEIINKYPDAYQRAYQGWFWKLSELAQDAIDLTGTDYDYEDYQAETLIKKAWGAFYRKDYEGVQLYARKCLRLYDHPGLNYQNESSVSHFLLGKTYLNEKNAGQAKIEFKKTIENYPETIYPNVKNYPYFNNITQKAKDQLALMETLYDFGNYTTETLTIKAWKSWDREDYRGVELYANKCIELWAARAREMQKKMQGFARGSFIPYYWAVNDIGTCHFILAMTYQKQKQFAKAHQMYQTVIDDFAYAQCWDPRGHYWKVAEVSQERLDELNNQK